MVFSPISERIKPNQGIWIIGDKFVKDSANLYFKTIDDKSSYTNRHFHVSICASDCFSSNNSSLLARLRNNLVHEFNKCTFIPKVITVVLEDAIINDVGTANFGVTNDFEIRTKWLISQYRKIIDAFIDYLPHKSKRDNWPKLLFISPSLHCNYRNNNLRKKFTRILEDTCAYTEKSTSMRLRTGWDYDDTNIFLEPQQRFTTEGLASFWHATDKVIEEYDQSVFQTVDAPMTSRSEPPRNEYSWQSLSYSQSRRGRGTKNWRAARF